MISNTHSGPGVSPQVSGRTAGMFLLTVTGLQPSEEPRETSLLLIRLLTTALFCNQTSLLH